MLSERARVQIYELMPSILYSRLHTTEKQHVLVALAQTSRPNGLLSNCNLNRDTSGRFKWDELRLNDIRLLELSYDSQSE